MRAALLNLARAEMEAWGYVTVDTRSRLAGHGIYTVELTHYLKITGVA